MPEAARATGTALHELTATRAAQLLRERAISPVELVQALLARAAAVDGQVQAWETLDAEGALAAARAAEHTLKAGGDTQGPLTGVPFGAKDIFDTAGVRTAGGFSPFDKRVPTRDAESIARLKAAGSILLGKLVTTQFAQADPSRTCNPWSAERTPAGSSSGSGAGVAARELPLALGSQTAGSVLRPAAYNGVVGFKPTYGRVSKRGVMPLAWSLDHVGVLSRSVADCALFLAVCGDHRPDYSRSGDQLDHTGLGSGTDEPRPPRLGLLRAVLDRAAPRVRQHLEDVARRFAAAGAEVREVELLTPFELILAVHHVTMQTEAAAVHRQLLDQYPGQHQARIRAYTQVGQVLPGAGYLHAQRLRRRIAADLARALDGVDALLLPTASDVAPGRETTGDPSFQAPFSLVGMPSISLPSGLTQEHLPLAIQLAAGSWRDASLLETATWCEARLESMPAPPL